MGPNSMIPATPNRESPCNMPCGLYFPMETQRHDP